MNSQNNNSVSNPPTPLTNLKIILLAGAAARKWKKQAARSKDRFFRLRELATTEEDYQRDLNSIKNNIKIPLLQCHAIDEIQANQMFANIDSMIQLSAQLSQQFSVKLKKWDRNTTMIGQTMIRFSKFMLVYSDFFKNFNQSQRKLAQLLKCNEYVKKIQKQLTVGPKIVTFQDLMSKPFQRPLKYHLILKDYASKTSKSHADTPFLEEAIKCYHKVNQQNNQALENKQKDHILITLDKRFGDIIAGQARYYVGQYQAIYIDIPVTLYLFSDMVILSQKEKGQKEVQYMRVYLQKYSYIQILADGNFFINRLYLYGKRVCVHLSFLNKQLRDEVYTHIIGLITAITKNQDSREDIINQRTTRSSVIQRRKSFTQLSPQLKRPMIISVLGNQKRVYGPDHTVLYFILQFHPTPAKWNGPAPHQSSLISLQSLLKLQSLCKKLYPQLLRCYSITHCPKGLSQSQSQKNQNKRLQFQTIFLHIQLNTIFRNQQILKRIDIFAYYLKISEPLWSYLKKQTQCRCDGCQSKSTYQNVNHYLDQKRNRFLRKHASSQISQNQRFRLEYCDLRTIKMQEMLANLPQTELVAAKGQTRITWIKSKLGWLNHTFTQQRGSSARKTFCVNLCNITNSCRMELEFPSITRIKTILDFLGQKLNVNLEDYALASFINDKMYILNDDQTLADVFPSAKEEKSLFSFFDSKDYPIDLYLRKLWVLQYTIESAYDERKIILQIDQIIYRLRYQQLRLSDTETQFIIALYYAHQHFIELDTITFNKLKMKNQFFNNILPSRLRNERFLQKIFTAIEEIKRNTSIKKPLSLSLKILEIVNARPGWSCLFLDAIWKENQNLSKGTPVRIGCDIKGLRIRQLGKSMLLFYFQFEASNWICQINGLQLIVRQQNNYVFYGDDLWKVKQQIQFYKLYYNSFLKKK